MVAELPMRFGSFQSAGTIAALAILFCVQPFSHAQGPLGTTSENSALSIPQAQLIQPAELNQLLMAGGADKPLVLQVGSRVLFAQAHIAGSEFAGAGSQPEGLEQLQKR